MLSWNKPQRCASPRRVSLSTLTGVVPGRAATSQACRARIEKAGAQPGFSRPGNPYDNAQAKAGWSTIKTELLPGGTPFASLEGARLEVAHYPDTYFNLARRHSTLGYRSPHQFKQDLEQPDR